MILNENLTTSLLHEDLNTPTGEQLRSRLLQEEYMRQSPISLPLEIENLNSVLVLAPHQDDEVIGAGGLLCQLRDKGCEISIAFLTDGVMTDEENSLSDEFWIEERRKESILACRKLGAKRFELGISNRSCEVSLSKLSKLGKLITSVRPDAVLLPWFLDAPAKHRFANHLLFLVESLHSVPEFTVLAYQVRGQIFSNAFVDITPQLEDKLNLIRIYDSQVKFHRYDHQSEGLSAWNSRFLPATFRKSQGQYVELFLCAEKEKYLKIVAAIYPPDLDHIYSNHTQVTKAAHDIQKWHTV